MLDCLCQRFPASTARLGSSAWARGRVLDAEGRPIDASRPYRAGLKVHYFREVPDETPVPFEERILHVDEHLVVADKPHFLAVMPAGEYVEQTLLARLCRRSAIPIWCPFTASTLTAGLVLFSANRESRGAYQALFRERAVSKRYEAICPALPGLPFPRVQRLCMVPGEPFFLMREGDGEPNSETRIEVLERRGELWRYALEPVTGRKHQLRLTMASLGAGICNDPFYPQLAERSARERDDYARPLKLLARRLQFRDPLSGAERLFESGLTLDW